MLTVAGIALFLRAVRAAVPGVSETSGEVP
jgi:hypothetical protein